MIERLLAADAALGRDDLDLAERMFTQVAEADRRNAIAVVGLGQVAARRGDADGARAMFVRALDIDPDDAAAARLLAGLDAIVSEPDAGVPEPDAADPEGDAVEQAALAPGPTRPSIWQRIRRWLGRNRGSG